MLGLISLIMSLIAIFMMADNRTKLDHLEYNLKILEDTIEYLKDEYEVL